MNYSFFHCCYSPVDAGKTTFYNSISTSELDTALDTCSDNLLKTSLEDFPTQKKDMLSSLNNNLDYFNPNFSTCLLQSRATVADCHTPPPQCHNSGHNTGHNSTNDTNHSPNVAIRDPFSPPSPKHHYTGGDPGLASQSSPGHSLTPPSSSAKVDPSLSLPLMSCTSQPSSKFITSPFTCESPAIAPHYDDSKVLQPSIVPSMPPQYISL